MTTEYLFEQTKNLLIAWLLQDYSFSVLSAERLEEQIFYFAKTHIVMPDYQRYIKALLAMGVLSKNETFSRHRHTIYTISGKPPYSHKEIVCSIFPYAYLSHISAMEWYGLTDKISKVIRLTCCDSTQWKTKALADLHQRFPDAPEYLNDFIPQYPKNLRLNQESALQIKQESPYNEPACIKNSPLRVSSIGKTFIDMLRNPELCGGAEHVLEIYQEQGKKYAKQIIASLSKDARKIDIARVGFVLDKIVGVKNAQLTAWQEESKKTRGSSKKLIYSEAFSPVYDEDWSLSINSELAQNYVVKN